MAEQELSPSQALGYIRRGVQTLRFLDRLEASARLVIDMEVQRNALDQAIAEKQQELSRVHSQLQTAQEQVTVEAEAQRQALVAQRVAHEEALSKLTAELDERQQATATAMANEEAGYLKQAREHEARLSGLQAQIAEREGYLSGIERRIGELRAGFDSVR